LHKKIFLFFYVFSFYISETHVSPVVQHVAKQVLDTKTDEKKNKIKTSNSTQIGELQVGYLNKKSIHR
jgi:hypothetical protein